MERWHEREAGWDEINKGKDSAGMVQDKDGVSPSRSAGNDARSGWRRGIRRTSSSRCRKSDPKGTREERVQYPGWRADGVSAAHKRRRSGLCARATGRRWRCVRARACACLLVDPEQGHWIADGWAEGCVPY
jgi:hypothetical protein